MLSYWLLHFLQACSWETSNHNAWNKMNRVRLLSKVISTFTIMVVPLKMNDTKAEQIHINWNLFSFGKKASFPTPTPQKNAQQHMNNYTKIIVMEIHCRLTGIKLQVLPYQFCKYLSVVHVATNSPSQFTDPNQFSKLTRFSLSILCCSFCLLRALWYNLGGGTDDFFNVVLLLGFADCLDSSFSNLWFSRSICLTSSFVKE